MTTEHEEFLNRLAGRRISRRDLLQIASKLGLSAAAIGPLLTACGGAATPAPTTTETQAATATPTATPTPGTEATATATPTASPTAAEAAEEPLSERERTLVVVYGHEDATIDPGVYWGGWATTQILAMYDNLMVNVWHEEDDTVEIVPQLAESWEVSPDNSTLTFHLRKGVTFHDGEPYNAEAHKFGWERHMALNEGPAYMLNEYVDKIEAVDELTLRVTLQKPIATYLQYLAAFWGPSKPVSPKAVKEHATPDDEWAKEWFRGNGVGTGPYKLDEWVPNQQYVLSKYDNYWQGWEGNHMERLIVRTIAEVSTQRLLLEKGDIDVIVQPLPPEDFKALEGKPGIVTKKTPSPIVTFLQMHCQRPPTSDVNVRRALAAAFDYEVAINNIYGGLATPTANFYPKGWAGYRDDVPLPKKDLELAKKYLADAGFADGLELEIVQAEGDEIIRRIDEMFQADLASIGVKLSIRTVSNAVSWEMQSSAETGAQMMVTYWTPDNTDSYTIAYTFLHSKFPPGGTNFSFYKNPEVDALLEKVQSLGDEEERVRTYEEIGRIVREDVPFITVCQQIDGQAWRESVKGSAPSPYRIYSIVAYDVYRG